MRNILILIGLVVAAYTTIYIQALLVWYTNIPETLMEYWAGYENIPLITSLIYFIVPLHLGFVIYVTYKKKIEWHWALPLAILPYMLGAIVQGLMF